MLGEHHHPVLHSMRVWRKGNPSQKPKVSSFCEIKGQRVCVRSSRKMLNCGMDSISFHVLFLFLRSHQVVMNDSCFTYSSCLFPFLDLQIFFPVNVCSGFWQSTEVTRLVLVTFFVNIFLGKKMKGSDSISKPSFIPSVEALHLLLLRSLSNCFFLQ